MTVIKPSEFTSLVEEAGQTAPGGRRDLRRLKVRGSQRLGALMPGIDVVSDYVELRDRHYDRLDFTGSELPEWRVLDCRFVDCVFDGAKCRGWRVWATAFVDCSFRGADLRHSHSSLGPPEGGIPTSYTRVDFSGADLRNTSPQAVFSGCTFRDSRLRKVDFDGSMFEECVFTGELYDVLFYDRAWDDAGGRVNEMRNVDMSGATLRFVGFRNLDLETLKPPLSPEHIVLPGYGERVSRAIAGLAGRDGESAERLRRFLEEERRWLGENQAIGILNRRDLAETFSHQPEIAELLKLLGTS